METISTTDKSSESRKKWRQANPNKLAEYARNYYHKRTQSDPEYKKKRKALSGAFFKSKMETICKSVKQSAMTTFKELQSNGDRNVVDLNTFTSKV